jgi:hypothetical protein
MSRVPMVFGTLILTQAAHSVEEYLGRLWESFPPAWALRQGRYTPGLATAPALLMVTIYLAVQLRRDEALR